MLFLLVIILDIIGANWSDVIDACHSVRYNWCCKELVSQLINEPTRVTNNSRTLIDHILTTTPDKVRCTKVPKTGISDHYPTVVVYKDTFRRKHTHITIKYRSEKNLDEDNFLLDLENCEWDILDNIVNVDKALEHWYQMFLAIVNKHALLKEKRVKIANQPEWITEKILQKMAERDHYKDIGDEDNYRQTTNSVTNMIELSKTEYYTTFIETNQGNSKNIWSYLRELVPKCVKHVSSRLIDGVNKLTDP